MENNTKPRGRPWPAGPRRNEHLSIALTVAEMAAVQAAAAAADMGRSEWARRRIVPKLPRSAEVVAKMRKGNA